MTDSTIISSGDVRIPETAVSVYDAIFTRRMSKEFTEDPVADDTLIRLFDAAIWAPNHRLTEPTRLFVLRKGSRIRERVAELAAEIAESKVVNPNPERKVQAAEAVRRRIIDAPALVYAYSVPGDNEEVTQENYATACCAVQNMALAAVAEGICLDWSTGGAAQHPDLADALGANGDWLMVGALFMGVPKIVPSSRRSPQSRAVTWLS